MLLPLADLSSSIDSLRRQLTNRLTLSEPTTSSPGGTSGRSSNPASLLTPPLSRDEPNDAPYKARDDDDISLSMKRRHSRNRKQGIRAYASSNDLSDNASDHSVDHQSVAQSKSLPDLRTISIAGQLEGSDDNYLPNARRPSTFAAPIPDGLPSKPRRWTMPAKGRPAQTQTDTSSSAANFVAPSVATKISATKTPAVISLRRATMSTAPPTSPVGEDTAYVSFPPPKFNRSKSSFLGRMWKADEALVGPEPEAPRRTSIVQMDRACPVSAAQADPVCTEVLMELNSPQGRRCSTRYVTKGSVYEVIWDENVTAPTSNSTSSNRSRSTTGQHQALSPDADRRHSIAMERLETQLFQAAQQSRKSSIVAASSPDDAFFQNMLDFKFSRFSNNAALTNLPRSRASAASPMRTTPAETEPSIDFFPPLQSQAGTHMSADAVRVEPTSSKRPSLVGRVPPTSTFSNCRRPTGSLLGQSTHVRRRSTDPAWKKRGKSVVKGMGHLTRRPTEWDDTMMLDEDETVPLLGKD